MALFGKKKGLVGLDIGSSAVKAVELKSGGKGGAEHQLVNIGMEALPPEAIVDGAIMDSGAVIDAIQRLFTSQKIKTADVATSVSGNAVIVKKISLPQMLLNVVASIMNINIIKGPTSIFNRDIAVGGNQYTDAIQKDLNLSFDQAEALKRGSRVEGAAPENLAPILQAVSENIALEIQKTFDFFKATSSEDRIDRIFLAGGTSKVHGLQELLADRFEAGVEIMNPFNNVTYNPRDFDPEFINEIGPSAAIAVGLAARKVGDR